MSKFEKYKQCGVQVWFLDEDLSKSAEYLTNIALSKSIDGAVSSLVCAVMYFSGIRNKKMYDGMFGRERRSETMERFFPGWPFRTKPQFKFYTSRTSKWTRKCLEHFSCMKSYLSAMLAEYEYRNGRRHVMSKFLDWLDADLPPSVKIPAGNIKSIVFPWKSLKKEFRRADVVEGYRLQFMDTFCWGDPMKAYLNVDRDVPEFVVRHFGLDTAGMVT